MLKSVDVLIGLIVILLALSMAVTVITQSITTVLNSRGRHLRRGLIDLLQLLDPHLTRDVSHTIATAVLRHPLVSGSSLASFSRLGNVIHREELTKLLMALALREPDKDFSETAKTTLTEVLQRNGITDPAGTLERIRSHALALERANPELSNAMRQNIAILNQAGTDFVAKIHNWFDQTIDRTAQRFTASTRVITFAGAVVVAVALQVDTVSIVNRLAADDKMREAFVAEASALQSDYQTRTSAAVAPAPAEPSAQSDRAAAIPGTSATEMDRKYRAFLAENGVIRLPDADWLTSLRQQNPVGILITCLLLSLGAPFWYNMLGKLLQLRSVLAFKDDAQRQERQREVAPDIGNGSPNTLVSIGAVAATAVPEPAADATPGPRNAGYTTPPASPKLPPSSPGK